MIAYGPQNRVDNFRADQRKDADGAYGRGEEAQSRREHHEQSGVGSALRPQDQPTGQLQQTGDFAYDEGDRKARSSKATMEGEQILLETGARIWDATGSTAGDHIKLDQSTGNFVAEGNVQSSRLPESDQKKNSEMLSGDEPLQATARKMDSRNRNRQIHYEGGVKMWQGANRIQADVVDIDRTVDPQKRSLVADGHVVTNLWEEPKDDKKKKTGPPVLTEVRAPHMVYTEATRLTHYTGGVELKRPGLQVKSQELRAFLAEGGADSRLDKALADGSVEILSTSKDRTRTGTGEHAEYYTADQKVILRGPACTWWRSFCKPQPTISEVPKPPISPTMIGWWLRANRQPGNTASTGRRGSSGADRMSKVRANSKPNRYPRRTVGGEWWTMSRSSCSRARSSDCWVRTVRGRPRRST